MAEDIKPIILTFGGGINARTRSLDINLSECVSGENFDLDPARFILSRRRPLDLAGTAPNAGEIRGFAQYISTAGTVSSLIQAGGNVYSWNGSSTFTLVGTVNGQARLRGPRQHNFILNSRVLITDLEKVETVKTWDGTTFAAHSHNLGTGFYAKYCRVHDERAYFANVTTGSTAVPHLLVGSKISDDTDLSVTVRPTSSVGHDEAFFLPMPDLKPINGLDEAFGLLIMGTERGRLHVLKGSTALDFEMASFYEGSYTVGQESIVNIGNDLLLGSLGRLESLSGTLDFGDVETNDISTWIYPHVKDTTSWKLVYDQRGQRVLCFPNDEAVCWVLHKGLLARVEHGFLTEQGLSISPWSKWTTELGFDMQPSTVWTMLNPDDPSSKESVFMGDSAGNIYRVDGAGDQDGGTADITVSRTSGVLRVPDGHLFDVEGWIAYTRAFQTTVTITFLYGGTSVRDQAITVTLPAATGTAVYSGEAYYSGNSYYNQSFSGRLALQDFKAAGHASMLQVRVEVTGNDDFDIHEVGIKIRTAERA